MRPIREYGGEKSTTFEPGMRVRITDGSWPAGFAVVFDASGSVHECSIQPGEVAIRLESESYERGDFHVIQTKDLVHAVQLPSTLEEVIAWLLQ